jgi:hypothetical protein
MFIGIAPILAISTALILALMRRVTFDRLVPPVGFAILVVVLLTLWVHGYSVYRLLVELPGVEAIRAVTRIVTVLLLPFAILLAASFDVIIAARLQIWTKNSIVGLLTSLLVVEASDITHLTATKDEWRARLLAVSRELPPTIPAEPILLLAPVPSEPTFLRELDAMLFTQDRGWRTINGYSGNAPPGYSLLGSCQDAPFDLALALGFLGRTGKRDYAALARDFLAAGYATCNDELLHRPQVAFFAGPVPAILMSDVSLAIKRLSLQAGRIVIPVMISNHGSTVLPAYSSTGMPIRLSARFLEAGGSMPNQRSGVGWDSRQDLSVDVLPGETQIVEIAIAPPSTPGTYRIAVSMVQETVAWFHDHGMQVPVSEQAIVVGKKEVYLSEGGR